MRFSVLTVTYNAQNYLIETLNSVASQQGIEFEHLVWDGGSTDQTLDLISKFPHIRLYQGKDCGIADAMNKVAVYAQGDFLIHLHADDVFDHPHVLLQVQKML